MERQSRADGKHALPRWARAALDVGVVYIPLPVARPSSNIRSFHHVQAQRLHRYIMAPRNALANISFTVDSASEDDMTHDELNAMPTPDSNTENKAPGRKARGKAVQPAKAASAAKSTAKGRPATRVADTKKDAAPIKSAAKTGRKALAERKNGAQSDEEEVDELDEDDITEATGPAKPKRGRPAKAKKVQAEEEPVEEEPVPAKRGRKAAAVRETPAKKEIKAKPAAKSRATKRGADAEADPESHTIPETQPEHDADPMDVEDSMEVEEIPESMPPPPRPSARRTAASRTRQPSTGARRAGSVSDTERDPAMRRKVGDLTKKLDAMTAKYETLKEAASSGKESNFEQLRKQTAQAAKGMSGALWSIDNG